MSLLDDEAVNQQAIADYKVEITAHAGTALLEDDWQTIESEAELPFFLTWAWVSTWLDTISPDALVVRVRQQERLVGIGLFTESQQYRRGGIKSTQLRLFQVGDNLMDQVWIEYNNLVCAPGHERTAILAAIQALDKANNEWDEIVISMMPESLAREVLVHSDAARIESPHPCFAVDLDRLRASGEDYLSSLTHNTRYQIRYAKRRYLKKYGALSLNRATDAQTALGYFREAGPLHLSRWDDSGFKNPRFVQFHESLISSQIGAGAELLKVSSGDTTVGIIYYHLVGTRVYFYLHGLMFDGDPKLKPGLVVHSLACQYFLERGMSLYDFMGGYSRYKLQLADKTESLVTVCIQRPRLRFFLETFARRLRDRLFGRPTTRVLTED